MIKVEVNIYEDARFDEPIEELCKAYVYKRGAYVELKKKLPEDRLAKMLGDQKARVRVDYGETFGGPGFSSVRISVSAEILCHQSEAAVEAAQNALYEINMMMLDSYVEPSYQGLLAHLRKIHGGTLPGT